ncbi:MAG: saccharopine dehydrogenase NADP-binding domain-containing protein [Rhodocyclaceae bacterium]|nr:saccharopine dehydrogenase NADP-binding domain-containing protein [Rhodocyclaceae bacterium]
MYSSPHPHAALPGRLLIVGTGCVAEGFLPLLWRHIAVARERVALLGPDPQGQALAARHGISCHACALSAESHAAELARHLRAGDVLLNLALGAGSLDLLAWCLRHDVLYLDTNLEPWSGQAHSLAGARSRALAMRGQSTAVVSHGANPGLVTHLLKQALQQLVPDAANWPQAARRLGLQVLQISEVDSHRSAVQTSEAAAAGTRPPAEFANTWSALGLAGELCAPAELAWGAQEYALPAGAVLREGGRGGAVELAGAALATRVAGWSPGTGPFTGWLLAHHEAMSMADLLTEHASDVVAGQGVVVPLRPTVFYAVQPCPAAVQGASALVAPSPPAGCYYRILKEELMSGGTDLGVLLLGERVGHWYGSRLTLAQARKCAPDNNAATLQVAAGVLGALVWALENPRRGVVEAEDMDHRRVLAVAAPYLGELAAIETPWRPPGKGPLRFERFLVGSQTGRDHNR